MLKNVYTNKLNSIRVNRFNRLLINFAKFFKSAKNKSFNDIVYVIPKNFKIKNRQNIEEMNIRSIFVINLVETLFSNDKKSQKEVDVHDKNDLMKITKNIIGLVDEMKIKNKDDKFAKNKNLNKNKKYSKNDILLSFPFHHSTSSKINLNKFSKENGHLFIEDELDPKQKDQSGYIAANDYISTDDPLFAGLNTLETGDEDDKDSDSDVSDIESDDSDSDVESGTDCDSDEDIGSDIESESSDEDEAEEKPKDIINGDDTTDSENEELKTSRSSLITNNNPTEML